MEQHSSPEHLAGHLEDVLARDQRVTEQGLHVAISDDLSTVTVTGTVTAGRRPGVIAEVVRERLPGAAVRDQTLVADYPEPDEVEEVR